jgi:rhodanese-related sulfurtransferase
LNPGDRSSVAAAPGIGRWRQGVECGDATPSFEKGRQAMKLKKGFRQLVDEAKSRIKTLTLEEARARHGKDDVVFVDLRDVRELEREGMIPDAVHCPRGMLEFWIDPESPYYKEVFGSGKNFIFYCNGAWRSALATDVAQQMGLEPVYEMDGGFAAWKKAGFPVAERPSKKPA